MNTRHRQRAAAITPVALAGLAGCSSSGSIPALNTSSSTSAVAPIMVDTKTANRTSVAVTMSNIVNLMTGARTAIARAEDILAAQCTTRFGSTDYTNQDYDGLAASFTVSNERSCGITGDLRSVLKTANDGLINNSIPQAWLEVWNYPRTEAGKTDGAACIATQSYQRHDPVLLVLHKLKLKDHEPQYPTPPEPEIQEAHADIQCKVHTSIAQRANAILIEHSTQLIEANKLALDEARSFYAKSVLKTNEVIARG